MTEVCRLAMQFTLLQIALGLVLTAIGVGLWLYANDMERRSRRR